MTAKRPQPACTAMFGGRAVRWAIPPPERFKTPDLDAPGVWIEYRLVSFAGNVANYEPVP